MSAGMGGCSTLTGRPFMPAADATRLRCCQVVRVHVVATVMPRNKGTPGLKETVHCVGFTADTDTDAASDWQGF